MAQVFVAPIAMPSFLVYNQRGISARTGADCGKTEVTGLARESGRSVPTHPKLRLLEPQLVDYQGQRMIYLHDSLGIARDGALIPQPLAPLLSLCDGTRDVSGLRSGLLVRTGNTLPEEVIAQIIEQLDDALLLENGAYQDAAAEVVRRYRQARHRPPSHAGPVYPGDAAGLRSAMGGYCAETPVQENSHAQSDALVGMLCPHIDYARGNRTYAELWQRAKPSLDDVELVIIFGTDHSGGLGMITPTRQSYHTPYGTLPTDTDIVDGLADVLGEKRAYQEEIHHINEHSIELASVWLHHFLDGRACSVVPILCGSFHHFVAGNGHPSEDMKLNSALDYLRYATTARNTLVIAAGDLAHLGPAFGSDTPLDTIARAKLAAADSESMTDICSGDGAAFFERSRAESDSRRICGISPIYLMLEYLNGRSLRGESMGYDQCPADPQGGSVVSIAGALLYDESQHT